MTCKNAINDLTKKKSKFDARKTLSLWFHGWKHKLSIFTFTDCSALKIKYWQYILSVRSINDCYIRSCYNIQAVLNVPLIIYGFRLYGRFSCPSNTRPYSATHCDVWKANNRRAPDRGCTLVKYCTHLKYSSIVCKRHSVDAFAARLLWSGSVPLVPPEVSRCSLIPVLLNSPSQGFQHFSTSGTRRNLLS